MVHGEDEHKDDVPSQEGIGASSESHCPEFDFDVDVDFDFSFRRFINQHESSF